MKRRGFLASLGALIAAPFVARAAPKIIGFDPGRDEGTQFAIVVKGRQHGFTSTNFACLSPEGKKVWSHRGWMTPEMQRVRDEFFARRALEQKALKAFYNGARWDDHALVQIVEHDGVKYQSRIRL